MIGVVLLGMLLAVGVMSYLGWTVDSRDSAQTLWPLERASENHGARPSALQAVGPPALTGRLRRSISHHWLRPPEF